MFSQSFFDRIPTKRGKAFYAIACGERLTKLEIKERAGLSMSTVISAVDSLCESGLVTVGERRVSGGGKPHSVIDVSADRCVYGVSYKAGKLFGVAMDLRGEILARRTMTPSVGVSAGVAVGTFLSRLAEGAPSPLAIGLALTCDEREQIVRRLTEEAGTDVLPLTNTQAIAYHALWQGGACPLAAIGIGNRVKCAVLGERDCRLIDLSELTLAPVFSEGKGIGALLSAAQVERVLFDRSYGGHYSYAGGDLLECRDLSDYSALLIRAIAGVAESVRALVAPREILLFGDYITRGFFDRIRDACPEQTLSREESNGEIFARGAAEAALAEKVFS